MKESIKDELERITENFTAVLDDDAEKEFDWYVANCVEDGNADDENIKFAFKAGYISGYFAATIHHSQRHGKKS